MITESELYWILKLDDIRALLSGCTIVLGIISVVLVVLTIAIAIVQGYDDPKFNDSVWREYKFARLTIYIALIVSSMTLTLLPSTKQMAAVKAIPAIVNSDVAKAMSSDAKELYKLGIDTLKEKLADTHSNKE